MESKIDKVNQTDLSMIEQPGEITVDPAGQPKRTPRHRTRIAMTTDYLEQLLGLPVDLKVDSMYLNQNSMTIEFICSPLTKEAMVAWCEHTPEGCEIPAMDIDTMNEIASITKDVGGWRWSTKDIAYMYKNRMIDFSEDD